MAASDDWIIVSDSAAQAHGAGVLTQDRAQMASRAGCGMLYRPLCSIDLNQS